MTKQPNPIKMLDGKMMSCPFRATHYWHYKMTFKQMLAYFTKLHDWSGRCVHYLQGTDAGDSRLYYEAHVTIEPVFDDRRDFAASVANRHNFKLAHLLMKKRSKATEQRSDKDTFMTGHSKNLHDIKARTEALVRELQAHGFKVWRYKIEDTILDSRNKDELELL